MQVRQRPSHLTRSSLQAQQQRQQQEDGRLAEATLSPIRVPCNTLWLNMAHAEAGADLHQQANCQCCARRAWHAANSLDQRHAPPHHDSVHVCLHAVLAPEPALADGVSHAAAVAELQHQPAGNHGTHAHTHTSIVVAQQQACSTEHDRVSMSSSRPRQPPAATTGMAAGVQPTPQPTASTALLQHTGQVAAVPCASPAPAAQPTQPTHHVSSICSLLLLLGRPLALSSDPSSSPSSSSSRPAMGSGRVTCLYVRTCRCGARSAGDWTVNSGRIQPAFFHARAC